MSYDILLLACRENSWCVAPFFHQINKFWPGVTVTLCAEADYCPTNSNHQFKPLPHQLRPGGRCPKNKFSDSLIWALHSIGQKNVVIMLADYWLYGPVDAAAIGRASDYMAQHQNVLRVDIGVRHRPNKPFNKVNEDLLECAETRDCFFPISLTPGLWNKDNYLKILERGCDPWQTERNSCKRYMASNMRSLWAEPGSIQYFNAQRGGDQNAIVMRRECWDELKQFVPARMKLFFEN